MTSDQVEQNLILAAEDCPPEQFEILHRFSRHDRAIMAKLQAHGPVLLRGGRGSGKSALMIAASRGLAPYRCDASAFGVYLSLRHLRLLRSTGDAYEGYLLDILIRAVAQEAERLGFEFRAEASISSVQQALGELSLSIGKRIVIFFDDAAHIGREASLQEFFDIFRTLSSNTVSCKAAIYPGVTRFGARFDVYNDATVVEVARNEESSGFGALFLEVAQARKPDLVERVKAPRGVSEEEYFGFVGQSVLGNMRAYVFAMDEMNSRLEQDADIQGLPLLTIALKNLAANYYWPLLDELRPKLGAYESFVDPSLDFADILFSKCGASEKNYALIHREVIAKYSKIVEILEYAGFIAKRDASMAMKSGGRGTRYALNLCNLLEKVSGARLTQYLFDSWAPLFGFSVEFHRGGSEFSSITPPMERSDAELGILAMPIATLRKGVVYPYGLTDRKIEVLSNAGYATIGDLAAADESNLMKLETVGEVSARRIKLVAYQAIWM